MVSNKQPEVIPIIILLVLPISTIVASLIFPDPDGLLFAEKYKFYEFAMVAFSLGYYIIGKMFPHNYDTRFDLFYREVNCFKGGMETPRAGVYITFGLAVVFLIKLMVTDFSIHDRELTKPYLAGIFIFLYFWNHRHDREIWEVVCLLLVARYSPFALMAKYEWLVFDIMALFTVIYNAYSLIICDRVIKLHKEFWDKSWHRKIKDPEDRAALSKIINDYESYRGRLPYSYGESRDEILHRQKAIDEENERIAEEKRLEAKKESLREGYRLYHNL